MNNPHRPRHCFPAYTLFLFSAISLLYTLSGTGAVVAGASETDTTPIGPFAVANYNPLPQMFGFPRDYVTGVMRDQDSDYALIYERTSFYTFTDTDYEHLIFDGESTHATFIYHQRVGNVFQWGLVIPYVSFESGSLDNFIVNWHDTFHLPQSGRDIAARNVLRIYYRRDGVTQFDVTQSTSGIGDVAINAAMALSTSGQNDHSAHTLNLSVKLPTGDSAQLLGSGAADVAVWLSGHNATEKGDAGYRVFGRLGLLALGKADILQQQQRHLLAFGGIGAGFRFNQTIRFKSQIDFHTALYKDSSLRQLSRYAIPLTMGGEIAFGRNTRLDIGVTEDLYVDVSPDVSFHFGLYTAF